MTDYHRIEIAHPELKELADAVADQPADRLARSMVKSDPEGQARYLAKYREVTADDPIQKSWDDNEPEFHATLVGFLTSAAEHRGLRAA